MQRYHVEMIMADGTYRHGEYNTYAEAQDAFTFWRDLGERNIDKVIMLATITNTLTGTIRKDWARK